MQMQHQREEESQLLTQAGLVFARSLYQEVNAGCGEKSHNVLL